MTSQHRTRRLTFDVHAGKSPCGIRGGCPVVLSTGPTMTDDQLMPKVLSWAVSNDYKGAFT